MLVEFADKSVKAPKKMLPPWMSSSSSLSKPSVTLTLSPPIVSSSTTATVTIEECLTDLNEGYQAWMSHRKETAWRLKRVEIQLVGEKEKRKREKTKEIEEKVRALKEEERAELERIEREFREEMSTLRRDAEAKEGKLVELWAGKHARLGKVVEHLGANQWAPPTTDMNGRKEGV